MLYILKNHRVNHEQNQYIMFDDIEQLKHTVEMTPDRANYMLESYEMLRVSPLEAKHMLNFKETDAGEFYPLPF